MLSRRSCLQCSKGGGERMSQGNNPQRPAGVRAAVSTAKSQGPPTVPARPAASACPQTRTLSLSFPRCPTLLRSPVTCFGQPRGLSGQPISITLFHFMQGHFSDIDLKTFCGVRGTVPALGPGFGGRTGLRAGTEVSSST